MVLSRSIGQTHVKQLLNRLPRYQARALDYYREVLNLPRREDVIYRIIDDNPEIRRIITEQRLDARRAALASKRRAVQEETP